MASGVQVASLFGVLGLDDGEWNRKLNKADKKAPGFGWRLAELCAFISSGTALCASC